MARSLRSRIRSWSWWKWGLFGIVVGIALQGLILLEIWREHRIVAYLQQRRVNFHYWYLATNTPLSRYYWTERRLRWAAVPGSATFRYEDDVDPDSIRQLRSLPFLSDVTFGMRYQPPLRPSPPAGRFVNDDDLAIVGTLTQLRALSFNYSKISDSGLRHLARLPRLRDLELKRAAISDAGLQHLGHMQSLRSLSLQQTQVTGAGLRYLRALPHLHYLSLQSTPLRPEYLQELEKFPSLRSLDLDLTSLTDDAIPQLSRLTMLQSLSVTGLSDEGLAKLRKALPNCGVSLAPEL